MLWALWNPSLFQVTSSHLTWRLITGRVLLFLKGNQSYSHRLSLKTVTEVVGTDGYIPSQTQGIWIWENSGGQWRTEEPGVLQSMGSQRVRHKESDCKESVVQQMNNIHSNVRRSLNYLNQPKCLHATNLTNENPFQISIVVIKKPLLSSTKTLWYCNIYKKDIFGFDSWHTAPKTLVIS